MTSQHLALKIRLRKIAVLFTYMVFTFTQFSCNNAKLELIDKSISPQPGTDGNYYFQVQHKATNTSSSGIVDNSVIITFFLNDSTEIIGNKRGDDTWDFKVEDQHNAYCNRRISGTFKAQYKRTSYFTGTENLTKNLSTKIDISQRDDIVFSAYLITYYPTNTPNPLRLEWQEVQGERVAGMVVINWSNEQMQIRLDDSQGDIKIQDPNNASFKLEKCGNMEGKNIKVVNLVCHDDEVFTPESLIAFATNSSGTTIKYEISLTCKEFGGS